MTKNTAEFLSTFGGSILEDYKGEPYAPTTMAISFNDEEGFFKCIAEAFKECLLDNNTDDGYQLVNALKNMRSWIEEDRIIYY